MSADAVPAPDRERSAAAARGARPASPVGVGALVGRDLRRFFRQPSRIVGSVAQPLILWAVLGAGLGGSFQAAGARRRRATSSTSTRASSC